MLIFAEKQRLTAEMACLMYPFVDGTVFLEGVREFRGLRKLESDTLSYQTRNTVVGDQVHVGTEARCTRSLIFFLALFVAAGIFHIVEPTYAQSRQATTQGQTNHQVLAVSGRRVIPWFSPNDLQLSNALDSSAQNRCSLVSVHSLIRAESAGGNAESEVYVQTGVGWIVVDHQQRLSVLTPAHVVSQGQILYAQCGERVYPLTRTVVSETLDLALLEIDLVDSRTGTPPSELASEPNAESRRHLLQRAVVGSASDPGLVPLIWFSPPTELSPNVQSLVQRFRVPHQEDPNAVASNARLTRVLYVEPGAEFQPQPLQGTTQGMISQLVPIVGHSAMMGHNQAFLFHNSGVRPGMSGSPMVLSSRLSNQGQGPEPFTYIFGMIIKSEANGSNSLAIPIDSITQFLNSVAEYERNVDPWKVEGVSIESRLAREGQRLVKDYELVVEDRFANKTLRFQEICLDQYPNTSDWLRVSRPSDIRRPVERRLERDGYLRQGRPERSWRVLEARGKSDHGDTGGGALSQSAFVFRTFVNSRGEHLGVLRSEQTCRTKAIRTPWGDTIDTLRWSNVPYRVDALTTLGNLLYFTTVYMNAGRVRREPLEDWLKRANLTRETQWPIASYCQALQLLQSPIYGVSPGVSEIRSQDGGSLFLKSYLQLTRDASAAPPDRLQGELTCEQQGAIFRMKYRTAQADAVVKEYDISIHANHTVSGFVQFSEKPECRVQLAANRNIDSANMWSHSIRDRVAKGHIVMTHHFPFIRANFFDVSSSCLPTNAPGGSASAASEVFLWEQIWDRTVNSINWRR